MRKQGGRQMRYRSKVVEIEALEWDGTVHGYDKIHDFTNGLAQGAVYPVQEDDLLIETLEGVMRAKKGDFIIKGLAGEFSPCKPEIFHAKYEEIT